MKKRSLYTFWTLLGGLLLFSACGSSDTESDNPLTEEEQESVEVRQEVVFAVADDRPVYQYVESQGVVEAHQQVTIKPKISGYVSESNMVEGRRVKEGDTLLEFDKQELRNAVAQAQNEYDRTYNLYQSEKIVRQSSAGLGSNGNDTTDQTDRGIQLRVGLAQAEVELKRAKLELSYATLTAPFSGTIAVEADQRVSKGAYVGAGTELGQLVNDDLVRVRFDVLESELNKVKEGMTVELWAPGGEALTGRVAAVSPVVDTESKTGQVIVRVDNGRGLLWPGMTVDGRILVQQASGKARIPRAAILSRDGGRTLVFKLHPGNNEVEWVYVEPEAQNSEWAIVNHESIEPGDTLAVDNHFALSHLQIVSPKMQTLQREEPGPEEEGQF